MMAVLVIAGCTFSRPTQLLSLTAMYFQTPSTPTDSTPKINTARKVNLRLNFVSISLKHPKALVYPNPVGGGIITVNLDSQYNKGTANVVIFQPVSGEYYATDVVHHGSKFTLDAFTLLPRGNFYQFVITLPDGNVLSTVVLN